MLASLGVLDVSALLLDRCTPILPMLAKAEASGHSLSLAEAGEGHHLPGLGDLVGTSFSQGLTLCKRNKQTSAEAQLLINSRFTQIP